MKHERFDFFGIQINATNLAKVTLFLEKYDYSSPAYVSFPDSSVAAAAQKNEKLKHILNNALMTLPDGKPSELYAKIKGYQGVSTVSGFWLCKNLLDSGLSHYFLGSTDEKLEKIAAYIKREHPNARVLGFKSPPFQPVSYFEEGSLLEDELKEINRLAPDLVWVGLSSPKQDFLLKSHVPALKHGVMLGVGGVFDYLSGEVKKSPEWVKKIGMRWLWRLIKEPKRLGAKYWMTIRVLSMALLKKKKKA